MTKLQTRLMLKLGRRATGARRNAYQVVVNDVNEWNNRESRRTYDIEKLYF